MVGAPLKLKLLRYLLVLAMLLSGTAVAVEVATSGWRSAGISVVIFLMSVLLLTLLTRKKASRQ